MTVNLGSIPKYSIKKTYQKVYQKFFKLGVDFYKVFAIIT